MLTKNRFMKTDIRFFITVGCCTGSLAASAQMPTLKVDKPNVIFIYADDLGMGMLSCLGQKEFTTPHIDQLFSQGTQFAHAYGCMVSAASRASLLTGYHDIRKEKFKISGSGQLLKNPTSVTNQQLLAIESNIDKKDVNLPQGDYYLPQIFKQAGYVTCQIGKLEYGWTATREQMTRHGWDHYYGYLDHVACHGFYPPYLFEDGKLVMIPGNTHTDCAKTSEPETQAACDARWNMTGKSVYSQNLFDQKMIQFINSNKNIPFFLLHSTQLPHGPVMIPQINEQVKNKPNLTQIEKEYASMVIRLDSVVGMLMSEVDKLGIAHKTMFIFTSDNGHEIYYAQKGRIKKPFGHYNDWTTKYYSDTHGDVFNGNGSLRGFKRQNSEGGPRVPMTMYLPGKIPSGIICNEFIAHYDLIPSFAEMLGVSLSHVDKKDGVSFWKTLLKRKKLPQNRYIVYSSYQGPAIVTNEGYKVRYNTFASDYDMYDLIKDPQERNNIARLKKNKFEKLKALLLKECNGNILKGVCSF